jgi:hypothetical protein
MTEHAHRLGPIWLSPGITRGNALTKLYASFISIGMLSGMSILVFSYFGGIWFDTWRPAGPFIVIGAVQVGLLIAAFIVRLIAPGQIPASAATTADR